MTKLKDQKNISKIELQRKWRPKDFFTNEIL